MENIRQRERPLKPLSFWRERNKNVEPVRSNQVVLVSYPKSGNTWLRFLIGNYLTGNKCDFTNSHLIVPDTHYNPGDCGAAPIFKSHAAYTPEYQKVIYLVRDGRDVAVSYYYHAKKFRLIPQNEAFADFLLKFNQGGMDDFGIWSEHVCSWLDHAPDDFLLIRYEDLKSDAYTVLQRVLDFCGLDVRPEDLKSAVAASTFKQMQQMEQKQSKRFEILRKSDERIAFVRSGKAGQASQVFTEEQLLDFSKAHGAALRRLGYGL
jgi:hypothetical protein